MPVTELKSEDGYRLMKVSHAGENGGVVREHHVVVDPEGELVQVGLTYEKADELLKVLTVESESEQTPEPAMAACR